MAKPAEKPKSKETANRDVNGVQRPDESRKKPPPAKPYIIRRTWL